MPRKNGTLTAREQTKALAKIDAEIASIVAAIEVIEARLSLSPESFGETLNGLYDAETALHAERRRVWLNVPQSAIDRMMANVD